MNRSRRPNNNNHNHCHRNSNGNRKSKGDFIPPDGGYGWVVVFSSFMINMIGDGFALSFGIIFVDLVDYFNESKSKTAFVGSILLSMPLLTGPVASALTDRYGCRRVTMVSGFLASFGFILGHFANSLEHLFLAFTIAGVGLAMSYVTSIVIVAYYFERRRSLATGLAVCGTGIGTFLFAPLSLFLLKMYGWRGTLLIMAGFFLNFVVFGALMRDLDIYDDDGCDSSDSSDGDIISSDNEDAQKHSQNYTNANAFSFEHNSPMIDDNGQLQLDNNNKPMFSSLVNIPTFICQPDSKDIPREVISELSSRRGGYFKQLMQRYPNLFTSIINSDDRKSDQSFSKRSTIGASSSAAKSNLNAPNPLSSGTQLNDSTQDDSIRSPQSRSPSRRQKQPGISSRVNSLIPEPGGKYLRNLRLQRSSLTYRGAMLNIRRYRLKASSAPDIYRNSMVTINESERTCSFMHLIVDVLKDIVDLSIFKSFGYFTLFCVSNFLLYVCIDVPYVYLPMYAIERDAGREEASYIISVIGIVNTLGIVIVGFFGDNTWLDPCLLYSFFVSISGISMAIIPLVQSYSGIILLASIYGFTISANYALVSVILVELISLDKFTSGYGLLLLVQGVASLVGPPFAGWLYDISGSYNATFYVTGTCIFVAGVIVLPIGIYSSHAGVDQNENSGLSGSRRTNGDINASDKNKPKRIKELSDLTKQHLVDSNTLIQDDEGHRMQQSLNNIKFSDHVQFDDMNASV